MYLDKGKHVWRGAGEHAVMVQRICETLTIAVFIHNTDFSPLKSKKQITVLLIHE